MRFYCKLFLFLIIAVLLILSINVFYIGNTEFINMLKPLTSVQDLNKPDKPRYETLVDQNIATLLQETNTKGNSDVRNKTFSCNDSAVQEPISIAEILDRLKKSPRAVCNCTMPLHSMGINDRQEYITPQSTCSHEATLLGSFQKVISYSLFKPKSDNLTQLNQLMLNYIQDIHENSKLMVQLYPGWVMRVYSNVPLEGRMCDVVCSVDYIYYCDVNQLPLLGDVSHINRMSWRFLVLGDGTVEKFAVRDLDSRLSQRERNAVTEWENSIFEFHGMRDHYFHSAKIMGGMWGGDNYKLCIFIGQKIRAKILKLSQTSDSKGYDQHILSKLIYSEYKNLILTHDSYLCNTFHDSVPFPSKRLNNHDFVGAYASAYNHSDLKTLKKNCPLQCRPKYGLDWEFC